MGKNKELFTELLGNMAELAIQYDNGDIELMDCLTQLEDFRAPLENGLNMIKFFKNENLENIDSAAKDYKDGYRGYMIEVRNGGRTFDYKNIEEWQTYNKALKDCEARSKQAFISKEKGMMAIDEDGVVIELPEVKYRKSSVIMKAKK